MRALRAFDEGIPGPEGMQRTTPEVAECMKSDQQKSRTRSISASIVVIPSGMNLVMPFWTGYMEIRKLRLINGRA